VYADPVSHARISDILLSHSTNRADIRRVAVQAVNPSAARAVLELGCGFGNFSAVLAPALPAGCTYVGVDLHEANGRAFLARVANSGVQARFLQARLPSTLDLADASFDLVVASFSFYFFPDMLAEVARLLRPGGHFLALTHSVRNLGELYTWFDSEANIPPLLEVIHRFSAENGETLLRQRFAHVRVLPFPNRLQFHVDQLDELFAYLEWKRPHWEGHCDAERVAAGVRERALRDGTFSLNKDDAIFVARKGGPDPRLFCSRCGAALRIEQQDGRPRDVCPDCGKIHYVNPLPVAAAIVVNEAREVLLVRRAHDPHKGRWCLPVGFAEVGETIAAAALRELHEEAGLEGEVVRLVDAGSTDDPFYGDLLIVTFEVRATGGTPMAGDDAAEVRWFPVRSTPRLAFRAHDDALARYVQLHQDDWRVVDSMRNLTRRAVRGARPGETRPDFVSDELVAMLEADREHILALWIADVRTNPATRSYAAIEPQALAARGEPVLGAFGDWLRGAIPHAEFEERFRALGRSRRRMRIPLKELLASFVLFKKHLWLVGLTKGVWQSANDAVRMLEMDRRVAAFFDHAIYHVAEAYEAAPDDEI
jgi:ADP-ribose pyrophosphatase YjhB (NUDIX family)/SAM-dependent methyltransferase